MKKYTWIVIATVLFFLGLIIFYALTPVDHQVINKAASAVEPS